ncbi:MAG: biotin/lipoyl-containing protein, partial [Myxococcota bacterium]
VAADGSLMITRDDGRRFRAVVSRDGSARWVSVGGRTHRVAEAQARGRGASGGHEGSLEAPMPGKVLDLKVAPGDLVVRGQVLVVVEAMKMEHAVKSPRDGTVARVGVAVGDMVNPGTPLVVLEEVAT